MVEGDQGMLAFLGVTADRRLLGEDLAGLPEAEPRPQPLNTTGKRDRLVAAGSLLTAATLIGGAAMALYGGEQLLFSGGGALDVALVAIGILLAGTHWGWVHVAEYLGLSIDQRRQRAHEEVGRAWLCTVAPYPRFSVRTRVLADASTRVERVLHKPVLTAQHTFTFVRETAAEQTYDAFTPAALIANDVESMRRQARLETDRLHELWQAASTAYDAALLHDEDEQQRLAAQRAAATALSEHLNASLLEPPLVD